MRKPSSLWSQKMWKCHLQVPSPGSIYCCWCAEEMGQECIEHVQSCCRSYLESLQSTVSETFGKPPSVRLRHVCHSSSFAQHAKWSLPFTSHHLPPSGCADLMITIFLTFSSLLVYNTITLHLMWRQMCFWSYCWEWWWSCEYTGGGTNPNWLGWRQFCPKRF